MELDFLQNQDCNYRRQYFLSFFTNLSFLLDLCQAKAFCATAEDIENVQENLQSSLQVLEHIKCSISETNQLNTLNDIESPVFGVLKSIQDLLNVFYFLKVVWDELNPSTSPSCVAVIENRQTFTTNGPGRPGMKVDFEQIAYLFCIGFKLNDIAKMYQMHRSTLWRKLKENNINLDKYSNLNDEELLITIQDIYQNHPHCGVAMMIGHLRSKGIIVQERRVRNLLRNTDPDNSMLRWGLMAQRRSYNVPGPNSLWHIDGHHALIRWKMVTHGGIDGYSRLILYLKCSNNNRAETVFQLFLEATEKYGLPSRVRGDNGCENGLVADFMKNTRDYHRGSFIYGRSVHNSRIERLWRDVYYAVIQTYYSMFYYLESIELLDVNNNIDLFCLHYVYLPRINNALLEFTDAYNSHKMRTEHNWSPHQMWVNGMIRRLGYTTQPVTHLFGIDPEAAVLDEEIHVPLEIIDNELLSDDQELTNCLMLNFNPLENSDHDPYGIGMFVSVREHLNSLMLG